MRRPAVWRFGLWAALATAAACWHGGGASQPQEPLGNESVLEAKGPDPSGPYWCSIDESGFSYDRFPCAIRKIDNHFELAKLGGSQRFVGHIIPDAQNGFAFSGKLYCPWGACDQPLHGAFRQTAHGELTGTFRDSPMTVKLVPAPAGAFGGTSYGGDGYGGFSDGQGGAFGGNSYGGVPTRRP